MAGLRITTLLAGFLALAAPAHAWEPTQPVQFIVPAGTGGGADQMARAIQGIVTKHNLMSQPIVVVNKAGGAGAEGFLGVKSARRNPHVLVISLSNVFTTPLATGIPFHWSDLTPVAMLALDEFVLWVHADAPYRTVAEFLQAARDGSLRMGGTGSKQEDQIITALISQSAKVSFTYVPFGGGGEVAVQLVGKHVDATVNNPIEAMTHWRAGTLRPLCVFDGKRLPAGEKMTESDSWNDIPTCRESGLDVEYLMLRGILMPAGVTAEQTAFYADLLQRVRETPEWTELMHQGAFNTTVLTGAPFKKWLTTEEDRHRVLMREAGFLLSSP